jgi:hypothetical protein
VGQDAAIACSSGGPKLSAARDDEIAWRSALKTKGADWVMRELQTRHGQPGDEVLDVVYAAPHPTRDFCQRWCTEQENRGLSMSPTTIGIMVAVVLVLVFTAMAVSAVENHRPTHVSGL